MSMPNRFPKPSKLVPYSYGVSVAVLMADAKTTPPIWPGPRGFQKSHPTRPFAVIGMYGAVSSGESVRCSHRADDPWAEWACSYDGEGCIPCPRVTLADARRIVSADANAKNRMDVEVIGASAPFRPSFGPSS